LSFNHPTTTEAASHILCLFAPTDAINLLQSQIKLFWGPEAISGASLQAQCVLDVALQLVI
jgi:hypothetical protein